MKLFLKKVKKDHSPGKNFGTAITVPVAPAHRDATGTAPKLYNRLLIIIFDLLQCCRVLHKIPELVICAAYGARRILRRHHCWKVSLFLSMSIVRLSSRPSHILETGEYNYNTT